MQGDIVLVTPEEVAYIMVFFRDYFMKGKNITDKGGTQLAALFRTQLAKVRVCIPSAIAGTLRAHRRARPRAGRGSALARAWRGVRVHFTHFAACVQINEEVGATDAAKKAFVAKGNRVCPIKVAREPRGKAKFRE